MTGLRGVRNGGSANRQVQLQRQAKAIKARAEVRGGCWNAYFECHFYRQDLQDVFRIYMCILLHPVNPVSIILLESRQQRQQHESENSQIGFQAFAHPGLLATGCDT